MGTLTVFFVLPIVIACLFSIAGVTGALTAIARRRLTNWTWLLPCSAAALVVSAATSAPLVFILGVGTRRIPEISCRPPLPRTN